jgi:hypothetical protein
VTTSPYCPFESSSIMPYSSTWTSFESGLSPTNITCVTRDPSQTTRLGDVGFVDGKGAWCKVANIMDATGQKCGIRALRRTNELKDYISERPYLDEPFVSVSPGNNFQILSHHDMAQYVDVYSYANFRTINPNSLPPFEKPSSESLKTVGVLIRPMRNTTSSAFIAGVGITVRELRLPQAVVNAWLRTYHKKICKAARRMMQVCPPRDRCQKIYLALTEFVTETWRTLFIRAGENPGPVALEWKTGVEGDVGVWNTLEIPDSDSVICGGMGSALSVCQVFQILINSIGSNQVDLRKRRHSCRDDEIKLALLNLFFAL